MSNEDPGSITHWLHQLASDDESVAQQGLWNRYFTQLAGIARGRLTTVKGRDADEEDVALSALNSFFCAAREGRFPNLQDRTGLWPLLVKMTACKAINEVKRQHAQKRTKKAEQYVPEMTELMGDAPTPQFAMELAEQVDRLMAKLPDEQLRTIAVMKLEGHTNAEIAEHFEIVERSVARKLARIRVEWQEHA
ncbi:ECF-type sigma factor [Adhaeretor mobilis]|uniref:RNA polymerase sigma factor n=1 Tax=Adhaeretor mobilis TaxID=1930276 RepID=A0A517MQG9_9BACT|nr:ECF-type sigma factor [Adhaeretor mobilis]QDS97027.1 RNA polymerase sigma factor [Adhaeretor mobilis]